MLAPASLRKKEMMYIQTSLSLSLARERERAWAGVVCNELIGELRATVLDKLTNYSLHVYHRQER